MDFFYFAVRSWDNMTEEERKLKASVIIQKYYRRYKARLQLTRLYTWKIFKTLEYVGEQDVMKHYNFFNALQTHFPRTLNLDCDSWFFFSELLESMEDEEGTSSINFCIQYPFSEKKISELINIFRTQKNFRLHPSNVADILMRSISILKGLPNINIAHNASSERITICGDLHGKFDDLLIILNRNGLPSAKNPYVFNGNFVDRGNCSLEVLLITLLFFIAYPGAVYLNRGNHEDLVMNQRYGFVREVQEKYKKNSDKLLKLIGDVYRWLPLATIVNNKVFIVHGGISETTDLDLIRSVERENFVSLLEPSLMSDWMGPQTGDISQVEWKEVLDILWSDPQESDGCVPKYQGGGGTNFGPDVTKKFLEQNNFSFIVRSHECQRGGYKVCHENSVITIFSASNYYAYGSNSGAFLNLIGFDLVPQFVEYIAKSRKRGRNFIKNMKTSASRELGAVILCNRPRLEREFAAFDPDHTGLISISQWCLALETATGHQIHWRLLKNKLVGIEPENNKVQYRTSFDIKLGRLNSVQGSGTVAKTLFGNKHSLQSMFRIVDRHNIGYISFDELIEACNLFIQHLSYSMTVEQVQEICRIMDINREGLVDLNKFVNVLKMVDSNYSN